MSSLWLEAWNGLRQKDRHTLPWNLAGDPDQLLSDINKKMISTKGSPITLPGGEKFFVRDILEKIATWVNKFIQVGDMIVQHDPGHAALPWAAVRLVFQASINNLDKHAAVLEGIEEISRYLLWSKIAERVFLAIPSEAHAYLEQSFTQLYQAMLAFLARALRFVTRSSKHHMTTSVFSTDSKLRADLDTVTKNQSIIESYTHQIADTATIEQLSTLQKVREDLAKLKEPVLRIEQDLTTVRKAADRNQREAILDWVSAIEYEKNFRTAQKKALAGTGQWLYKHRDFSAWQNCSSSQMLWLHGGAGTGKSTLISILIKSLIEAHNTQSTPYPAYFYCSRSTAEPERSDPEQVTRSLMRQVSELPGGPPLHCTLQERHDRKRVAGSISIDEATEILLTTIQDRPLTYIMVDALDECEPKTRHQLIGSLEAILSRSSSLVKIFVTSRDAQDIAWSMQSYPQLRLDASQNQADIDFYIHSKVDEMISRGNLLPTQMTDDLQQKIKDCLCNGAQGMFRWVELQLQHLCTIQVRSVLLKRLGKLPPDLEEIYQDLYVYNLAILGEDQAAIVKRIFSWLLVAQRQLRTREFLELICSPDGSDLSPNTLLNICFNLVTHDSEQDQFRFSHLSVREFLEKRPGEFGIPVLHNLATSTCLDLLATQTDRYAESYAATYWLIHAESVCKAGVELSSAHAIEQLLCSRPTSFSRWRQILHSSLFAMPDQSDAARRLLEVTSGESMHAEALVASSFGLATALGRIVSSMDKSDVLQVRNAEGEDALYLASRYGHVQNIQILLDIGADVSTQARVYRNALHIASHRGHEKAVQLLLDKGADVDIEGGRLGVMLQAASRQGHEKVVQLLLDNGADVNTQGGVDGNALQAASHQGHEKVVQLLLDNGANVNAQGGYFGNALQAASEKGDQKVVQILLHKGADVNTQDDSGGNALRWAHLRGHEEIVQMLLNNGANVQDMALQEAADRSGMEIM